MSWYVFDNLEIVMGPYETKQWAEDCLQEQIDELYFLEYYPNPYVDFIENSLLDEMYFNMEDWEYSQYKEMWGTIVTGYALMSWRVCLNERNGGRNRMHLCDCNLNYGKNCLHPKDYETIGCNHESDKSQVQFIRELIEMQNEHKSEDNKSVRDLFEKAKRRMCVEN
ncbi:hypothetical protein D3C85_392820 [compost metagenome]